MNSKPNAPSGLGLGQRLFKVRNGDVELRFKMREASEDLSRSIGEHGVLVHPIVLELTEDLKKRFNTKKPYICVDGHCRLGELPPVVEVECLVLSWDELLGQSRSIFEKMGVDSSSLSEEDILKTYILRLHACREPLPKDVYVSEARRLKSKGFTLRQAAAILGIAKSTLHDWLKKEPVKDDDLEASSPQRRKQCGLCGNWIKKGAQPLWFHPSCHDKVVNILESQV